MNEYICTSRAHAPITFLTVRGRVLSQTLTSPILSFLALIKTFLKCWSTLIVRDSHEIYKYLQAKRTFLRPTPVQKNIL